MESISNRNKRKNEELDSSEPETEISFNFHSNESRKKQRFSAGNMSKNAPSPDFVQQITEHFDKKVDEVTERFSSQIEPIKSQLKSHSESIHQINKIIENLKQAQAAGIPEKGVSSTPLLKDEKY